MGFLNEGKWVDQWYQNQQGRFVRPPTQFRNSVTLDGSSGFKGVGGRYHLYISLACPWAHRTLILRKLKGLQQAISVTVVSYLMKENGWTFTEDSPDPLGFQFLHQVYTLANPTYTGRVTVPVLWDKQNSTIVSNQSQQLILMLNSEFDCQNNEVDYYPEPLREEIEQVNKLVYQTVNNGVYRAGFSTSQEAYNEAVHLLFETLDQLEERLGRQRYLCGEQVTLADVRLFTTLVRFDCVYVGHFKCNLKRIQDYPNLINYVRDLYQYKGIHETVDFEHIKGHYYMSHLMINPTGIVPEGPIFDYMAPHDRERFSQVKQRVI